MPSTSTITLERKKVLIKLQLYGLVFNSVNLDTIRLLNSFSRYLECSRILENIL